MADKPTENSEQQLIKSCHHGVRYHSINDHNIINFTKKLTESKEVKQVNGEK
jgi:hypothetical protein